MSGKPFVHIEIPAQDPVKAGEFYSELFGWECTHMPEMDYVTFNTQPELPPMTALGGGFPRIDGETYKPNDVVAYVDSDDIEATLRQIEKLGGKALTAKMEIPGIGWFAFFCDPSGNRLALFTAQMPVQS
jgi:uncharacterized protein